LEFWKNAKLSPPGPNLRRPKRGRSQPKKEELRRRIIEEEEVPLRFKGRSQLKELYRIDLSLKIP